MPVIVKEVNGTTCPECGKVCKTLAGLSKHLNTGTHNKEKSNGRVTV